MDPLTDVFQTLHVANVVHARLDATAPWGLKQEAESSSGTAKDSAGSASSPFKFAHFGMVSRGNCWLSVEGIPNAMPLTGGDCFLLAPGISYALGDSREPAHVVSAKLRRKIVITRSSTAAEVRPPRSFSDCFSSILYTRSLSRVYFRHSYWSKRTTNKTGLFRRV